MLFSYVSETFEQINLQSGRIEKTKLLSNLLKNSTAVEAQIISYLSLGELRAPYHGSQFALADKSIKKILAELYNISPELIEERSQKLGDLGVVLLEQPAFVIFSEETLTVQEVYNKLCDIEKLSGTGSQDDRKILLKNLLQQLSPISGSFILKIILSKLRLGFSDMTLIDALSWTLKQDKSFSKVIERAYNICADIGLIAYTLKKDGIEGIENMQIHLGIPIRLAAAERAASAQEIFNRMGECVAQPKIDGFRLQIHKEGNNIWFFSRNLLNMSDMFPDLKAEFFKNSADNYIIEGEAVVYDPERGSFVAFQETIKRKRKHEINSAAQELPLNFLIFDLLFADNKSWINKSHFDRRSKLIDLFGEPKESVVTVIPEKVIISSEQLEHYFLNSLAEGFEGLVVKKTDSIYQAGKRNFNWIKLKRQEGTKLQDHIDAVILGYYAGKGKRSGFGIGAFLVGVYDSDNDSFKTIAKIGTGLSDQEWRDLKIECDKLIVVKQPDNVVCSSELFPTVWIIPKIVVEIRADEITRSPSHTAGLALRFPRFMSIRSDKSAEQANTVKELQELYKLSHTNN